MFSPAKSFLVSTISSFLISCFLISRFWFYHYTYTLFRKMDKGKHISTWEFWKSPTSPSSLRSIGGECNTRWFMIFFSRSNHCNSFNRIMLAWLTVLTEKSQKIDDLPILATLPVWSDFNDASTSKGPIAHGSLWLILHQHFERVICVLLMWPPFFFRAIPTYGILPYTMRNRQFVILSTSVGLTHAHPNKDDTQTLQYSSLEESYFWALTRSFTFSVLDY